MKLFGGGSVINGADPIVMRKSNKTYFENKINLKISICFQGAAAAVLWRASRSALCLAIVSPLFPQQRAWSPSLSLGARNAGQEPELVNTSTPPFSQAPE